MGQRETALIFHPAVLKRTFLQLVPAASESHRKLKKAGT